MDTIMDPYRKFTGTKASSLATHKPENGWNTRDTVHTTEVIGADFETTEPNLPKKIIQKGLLDQIVEGLYESGLVKFEHQKDAYTQRDHYRASVNVAAPEIHKMVISEDFFQIDGEEFTKDEMEESLRYTYPERFL